MRPAFDPQPVLEGHGVRARPLAEADLDGLYAIASDPHVWELHPARTRHEHAVFAPYFHWLLGTRSVLAFEDLAQGRLAGMSRYYTAPDQPDGLFIGFTFLGRDWWGGATNRAVKTLMLDHAFAVYDAVWFHIDLENLRSQRATGKLGATHIRVSEVDLGTSPAPRQLWRLTRADWQARAASL